MSGGDSLDFDKVFSDSDPLGDEIANTWMEWNGARVSAKERWKETQQYVYATSTRETNNANVGGFDEEDEGWGHSTHVPKITQIFDNLTANYMSSLMPHEEWFKFIGEDEDSVNLQKRRTVESYLRTKHRLNGFRTEVQRLVNDWVLFGNCFAMVTFEAETSAEPLDEDVKTTGYVGPRVRRISPYDIVMNPLATDFDHSPKIIRTLKTLGELQRDIEDFPEMGYSQEVFEKVIGVRQVLNRANVEDFDKSTQMSFDGFGTASQYFNSGFVEILEFYGDMYDIHNQKFLKNHVITVVDRKFVLRAEPLKTTSGRPNIFHCGWRLRQDNLWAMSPLANLIGTQYMINHLENARADAFDQMLAPTRILVGDVESDGVKTGTPGGEYRIPSGEGSVSNLLPDTTVLTADIQIDRKSQQMEEFAGSPKQAMGFKAPGEQTATEASILDRGSSRIFQNKISYFEEEFLEKIINAEVETARRNLHTEDIIKVVDDTGIEDFLNITKDDLLANGKLVPIGARHFARQNQLAANLQQLNQAFAQDQLMMQHFPSKRMAELWAELLQFDRRDVMMPFARVGEQAEMAKLSNAAQTQVESEDMVDVGGEEGDVQEEQL